MLFRSGISTAADTKAVTLTLTNSSGADLTAGAQLLSFAIPTLADFITEVPETYRMTLTSSNARVSTGVVTTTIQDAGTNGLGLTTSGAPGSSSSAGSGAGASPARQTPPPYLWPRFDTPSGTVSLETDDSRMAASLSPATLRQVTASTPLSSAATALLGRYRVNGGASQT